MAAATRGLAGVRVLRPGAARALAVVADPAGELMFGFVLEGAANLAHAGQQHPLGACDAFAIPPGAAWKLDQASADFSLLQVVLPA
jgi:glyoxylate utilization-related uncharacterized protein